MKKLLFAKNKGVNLTSILVGSVLGVFVLGTIVNASLTISENYQVIKAYGELDNSARFIYEFMSKVVAVTGYNDPLNVNNLNEESESSQFTITYTGGIEDAIDCNGTAISSPISMTFQLDKPLKQLKCLDGTSNVFLVDPKLVDEVKFSSIAENISDTSMSNIIPVTSDYNRTSYYAKGARVAVLLKSSRPVFNVARNVEFNWVNGQKFTRNNTKYAYRLINVVVSYVYPAGSSTYLWIN